MLHRERCAIISTMKQDSSEDLAALLDIDQLRLDRECVKQPGLYFTYANKLADAKLVLEECDSNISATRVTLAKKIRANPTNYGLDKITEAALHEVISGRDIIKQLEEERRKARHRVDVLGAFVTALEHRKRSLTLLVDLHGQKYFANPADSASAEGRDAAEAAYRPRAVGMKKTRKEDR